ncbi:hypothetical protein CBL_00642 [Carabus blaptoides fortunei]
MARVLGYAMAGQWLNNASLLSLTLAAQQQFTRRLVFHRCLSGSSFSVGRRSSNGSLSTAGVHSFHRCCCCSHLPLSLDVKRLTSYSSYLLLIVRRLVGGVAARRAHYGLYVISLGDVSESGLQARRSSLEYKPYSHTEPGPVDIDIYVSIDRRMYRRKRCHIVHITESEVRYRGWECGNTRVRAARSEREGRWVRERCGEGECKSEI